MDCYCEVVFGYAEHLAVDFEDQWSEGGDKDKAEQEEAEVDQYAPEEEVFGLGSNFGHLADRTRTRMTNLLI